ncbi:MAG: ABC transporter substrate-binding protein [Spirochaetales bacterium]|nr:ABC transporter substrate-binding protein [Spirochaetales bacterium]
MKRTLSSVLIIPILLLFFSCGGSDEELSFEEAMGLKNAAQNEILQKTVYRPGRADLEMEIGKVGGTWYSSILSDPETFNIVGNNAEQTRTGVLGPITDYLVNYNHYKREWIPALASFEINSDEKKDTLDLVMTMRDDLYWTTADGKEKVKVTAEDIVFWYNEIEGNRDIDPTGYTSQLVEMKDGTTKRVEVEQLNELQLVYHFPRIVANPLLNVNTQIWPMYRYKAALEKDGPQGVFNLFGLDTDVKTIPAVGPYHLVEYQPGVRLVYRKNPDYWHKDNNETRLPYIQEVIKRIVPDMNADFLMFKEGTKDGYVVRPEDLDELLQKENPDYTVYNAGESLSANFFGFNQNPDGMDPKIYRWMKEKEFRQALSCLLDRQRIADQVYRGLAVPTESIFCKENAYYDKNIKTEFTYNPEKAAKLLAGLSMAKKDDGLLYDTDGNKVEFDIVTNVENNIRVDVASIFSETLKEAGITANVRPIDFNKLVEMLTVTYDWHVILISLGVNFWPTQGPNVWLSNANLHFWHPLQEEPATEWEARLDYLYNEGRFTYNTKDRKKIYDEFQKILLEQVPLTYTVNRVSFAAYRNKWANMYVDQLYYPQDDYLYLKE